MTQIDRLRPSRDGDQFHYHWAARQSLRLLRPDTDLTAISVEGISHDDRTGEAGDESVDLAEYYGSDDPTRASRVIYRQLKHSTVQIDKPWPVSGLKKALVDFAKKYRLARAQSPGSEVRLRFSFVSNRRVSRNVRGALDDILAGSTAVRYRNEKKKIKEYLAFGADDGSMRQFCSQFDIDASGPSLLPLRHLFKTDIKGLLAGGHGAELESLVTMVANRASSIETNHVITRRTLLSVLGVDEDDLLPAPNLINPPRQVVEVDQTARIAAQISHLDGQRAIVHASAGIGKSIFATQLGSHLPADSITVVYDCFGDGRYRNRLGPRHAHDRALVQISNELASQGLCDPLIPSKLASPEHYLTAFASRVGNAAAQVSAVNPAALLTIVVDAADNAMMFATDTDTVAFVPELLHLALPSNARVVLLCRSERVDLLGAPSTVPRFELRGFTAAETKQFAEFTLGPVSDDDAAEFCQRTSANPRVQAMELEGATSMEACLAALGNVTGIDTHHLNRLIGERVQHQREAHRSQAAEIDRLCEALATLRPQIPIRVLAELCDISPWLIRSFAAELGRPLLIDGDTLQFRDEPTESWFRDNHRPQGRALDAFIERILPLADDEPYIALALPPLLWEARQVETLVELSLSDASLPQSSDLETKELARIRASFALQAVLRTGRHLEAARLALRVGALTAGHARRLRLLRENTDLAGRFLDPATSAELIASRSLAGAWPGSHLLHEAAMLSAAPGQTIAARNRLRSAANWIYEWVNQDHDRDSHVTEAEIAEIALGILNTDGVGACIAYLGRWSPDDLAFDVGLIVANRLADAGRMDELEALATNAVGKVKYLPFAMSSACWEATHIGSKPLAQKLVGLLRSYHEPVSLGRDPRIDEQLSVDKAVIWIITMGLRYRLLSPEAAEQILTRTLPGDIGRAPGLRSNDETATWLFGFALLDYAGGRAFDIDRYTDAELREPPRPHTYNQRVDEFRRNVLPLVPWAVRFMRTFVDDPESDAPTLHNLVADRLRTVSDFQTPVLYVRSVGVYLARILALDPDVAAAELLGEWCAQTSALGLKPRIEIIRALASRPDFRDITLPIADAAASSLQASVDESEYRITLTAELARAVLRCSAADAKAVFMQALGLADQVGDEVPAQYRTLLNLASAAAVPNGDDHRRAYRVAQILEGLTNFMYDLHEAPDGLAAVAKLSPNLATAIASRWRDRRVSTPSVFAAIFDGDTPTILNPLAALALLPFNDRHALKRLAAALAHDPEHGARTLQVASSFLRHQRHDASAIDHLKQECHRLRIDVDSVDFELHAPYRPYSSRSSTNWEAGPQRSPEMEQAQKHAQSMLAALDLTEVEGWETARAMTESRDSLISTGEVFTHASQVPTSRLASMIEAFLEHPRLDTFYYKSMIELLEKRPTLSPAARSQARELAHTAAQRFPARITLHGYDPLDTAALARICQQSVEVIDLEGNALRNLGARSVTFSTEQCLHLVARLTKYLSQDEASKVLDDFTEAFEQTIPPDTADGRFEDLAQIPERITECFAGYLWSALGAVDSDTRWRAAHSVRLLIELGCGDELTALNQYALGTLASAPFTDARLPFYTKHALLWLLLAIARAAEDPDNHTHLGTFTPLLRRILFTDEPHALLHSNAAKTLIILHNAGSTTLAPEDEQRLQSITKPPEVIHTSWSERRERGTSPAASILLSLEAGEGEAAPDSEAARLRFFLDFEDYWCRPLAEAFGVSGELVEQHVSGVILDRWGIESTDGSLTDPRSDLRLYKTNSTTSYHASWPKEETYQFYLAMHALWSIAEDLRAKHPIYFDDDMDCDYYQEWVRRFQLARIDGRWRFDRRDAPPPSIFTGDDHYDDPDWIWRLNKSHFDARLSEGPWVHLWEDSYESAYDASQRVTIRSALVTPVTARALALAAQTAPSYMGYRIPSANDDDFQIHEDDFDLTGWIVYEDGREGIDSEDPLAGSTRLPPPRPSEPVVQLLGLTADHDQRNWKRESDILITTRVWGEEPNIGECTGERMSIRREALAELLAGTGKNIIVEVMINRSHKRGNRDNQEGNSGHDERSDPLERPYKIYLFDANGGCSEL